MFRYTFLDSRKLWYTFSDIRKLWYTLLGSRKLLYTFKTAENCYTPLDSRKLLHTFKTAENCYTLSRQQKTDTGYRYDIDFVWALGLMPSGTLSDTLAQSEGQNNPFAAMLCDTGRSRVIVCCEVRSAGADH